MLPESLVRPLRAWQRDGLEKYLSLSEPQDFLVTATPGAGKTRFALAFARWLLDRRVISRIIVVAPTDHLRKQWAVAAHAAGVNLDANLGNDVGPVGRDFHGYVTTYAQVAQRPPLHRRRTEERTTLVILDEIHHAGDGLLWGDGVREAFDPAERRLALTGTPFRTSDTETIPFVRYEEDGDGAKRSVADHSYDYTDALRDGVVRPVMFAAYSGESRWRTSAGEVISASLTDTLTREQEMAAWRTALNPHGEWISHVVAAADERLTQVRRAGMRDAGAMLLASDQDAAREYAKVVERVTGAKPVLVLSEDPGASKRIDEFASSRDRWLVSVRMVSEGVDVPRLAVGVWATAYRTPLFFAQGVGRFVRARRTGETATVFLPAVRPLLTLAAAMEEKRDHVLPPPKTTAEGDGLDAVPQTAEQASASLMSFEALDARAQFAHVLFAGRAVVGDESAAGSTSAAGSGDGQGSLFDLDGLTAEDEDYLGLPGLLDPAQMATLLRRREADRRRTDGAAADGTAAAGGGTGGTLVEERPGGSAVAGASDERLDVRARALRSEISSLVSRLALRTSVSHADVHRSLISAVPGPRAALASVGVLERRRDYLLERLR